MDFVPGGLHECAVANVVWSTVFAYRPKKKASGKAPKTVADFFDLDKFPGKRGMRRSPIANLEFALMADDVPVGDVYTILATKEGARYRLCQVGYDQGTHCLVEQMVLSLPSS